MMKMMSTAMTISILAVGCGGVGPDVGEQSGAVKEVDNESKTPWLDALDTAKKSTTSGWGGPCGGFVANPKKCQKGLTCVASHVNPDLPGTCEPDCVVAGGECVALAPGTCNNGTTGGHSCGTGLGVTCCMPKAAGPTCAKAADCTGALPQICQVCSGGNTACAHWSCVKKHCEVAVCN